MKFFWREIFHEIFREIFHEIFREIFHEIFREIFLKYIFKQLHDGLWMQGV